MDGVQYTAGCPACGRDALWTVRLVPHRGPLATDHPYPVPEYDIGCCRRATMSA